MPDQPNVMIGTPAYNGMVHTDYVHSLLSYNKEGIKYAFLSIAGESLITRARNSIIARFYHSKEFSHLLFLDGDVYLDGKDLNKLLDHKRDVIGAPVPLKTREGGKPVFNIGGNLGQEDGLVKVERLGTAAMLLSRRAATALVENARENGDSYLPNPLARGIGDTDTVFDIFKVGVRDDIYLSEDFWACRTLRELGFDIFVDLTIATRHHGMRSFTTD